MGSRGEAGTQCGGYSQYNMQSETEPEYSEYTEYQSEYHSQDWGDYGQHWGVDRVKLQFKTVDDLLSLLKTNDIQIYSQSAQIHSELRKELYSVTQSVETSSPTSSKVSSHLSEEESHSYLQPSLIPPSPPANQTGNLIIKMLNNVCLDNCHLLILTTVTVTIIFLLTLFSIIILCRRKNNYVCKSRQGKCQDVQSSYIKSSISLDGMPAPGPPNPSISPVSVLHNSP